MAVDTSQGDPRFQSLLALFYAEEAYHLDDSSTLAMMQNLTDNADVQAGYAWALYNLDDTAGALKQLDALLADNPDQARGLYYKARILLDSGQVDEARGLLQHVVSLDSTFREDAQNILNTLAGSS